MVSYFVFVVTILAVIAVLLIFGFILSRHAKKSVGKLAIDPNSGFCRIEFYNQEELLDILKKQQINLDVDTKTRIELPG